MRNKLEALYEKLKGYEKLAIALSGGLDSSFLFAESVKVIGAKNVLGVHIISPLGFSLETERAKKLADSLKAELVFVNLSTLEIPGFADNPPNHCYICKREEFKAVKVKANKRGFEIVADGTNADDPIKTRPGMRASEELGVVHPLREAGLTKDELRRFAKSAGYDFWNIPPQSCAMSRFPFGFKVNLELIEKVKACEDKIRSFGFWLVRLRYSGDRAKVEVVDAEFEKAQRLKGSLAEIIRESFKGGITEIVIERYKPESQR